ncbi:uncharacterized protein [Argopecten irradians]|uniref:uncharacterized protein n=1 Tax=Argopecten irradians TaxID=31199 RepID=UPI0037141A12
MSHESCIPREGSRGNGLEVRKDYTGLVFICSVLIIKASSSSSKDSSIYSFPPTAMSQSRELTSHTMSHSTSTLSQSWELTFLTMSHPTSTLSQLQKLTSHTTSHPTSKMTQSQELTSHTTSHPKSTLSQSQELTSYTTSHPSSTTTQSQKFTSHKTSHPTSKMSQSQELTSHTTSRPISTVGQSQELIYHSLPSANQQSTTIMILKGGSNYIPTIGTTRSSGVTVGTSLPAKTAPSFGDGRISTSISTGNDGATTFSSVIQRTTSEKNVETSTFGITVQLMGAGNVDTTESDSILRTSSNTEISTVEIENTDGNVPDGYLNARASTTHKSIQEFNIDNDNESAFGNVTTNTNTFNMDSEVSTADSVNMGTAAINEPSYESFTDNIDDSAFTTSLEINGSSAAILTVNTANNFI